MKLNTDKCYLLSCGHICELQRAQIRYTRYGSVKNKVKLLGIGIELENKN